MAGSIFISSSGDLRDLRKRLHEDLRAWLEQHGLRHLVEPYLWEEDKEDGRLLSDRQRIQSQLPDPASREVPLTICLFGERCGSPLEDELDPHVLPRFKGWWAEDNEPGLLHPWPNNQDAQERALANGQYPLTGTVYELISAHSQPEDADNLIVAYCADSSVTPETKFENVVLNGRRLHLRLTSGHSKSQTQTIDAEIYEPQVRALLNLLKHYARKKRFVSCHPTEEAMHNEVFRIAQHKIREKYGIASLRNPFKDNLTHWTIDDEKLLPGRGDIVGSAVDGIVNQRYFLLLTGRSGCGKSSLLQSGIMRTLREKNGFVPVAFRPTELMAEPGEDDALDKLANLIAETAELPFPAQGPRAMRPENHAVRLSKALEEKGIHLVLGLDQFEEIIDELKLENQRNDGASEHGWWLVIHFLAHLCRSPHVRLAATLESARESAFLDLKIPDAIGLPYRTLNADVTDDTIARIAQNGFSSGGLPLDVDLVEVVKRKWREFEQKASGNSASPLPLACLLFHDIYENFSYLAGATPTERLEASFRKAGSTEKDHELTLEDIGGEDKLSFDHMITKLADAAWQEGGGHSNFEGPIEKNAQFNPLNNFLSPLVTVDSDGTIQLRAPRENDADHFTLQMRRAFRNRRLLVSLPGEGPRRVRLAHQALVDQWPPARRWYSYRKRYLEIVQRFREEVSFCAKRGQSISPQEDGSTLSAAALTLQNYYSDWQLSRSKSLSTADRILMDQALAIFDTAQDPSELIEGSHFRRTYAHLAADYHRVDLLRRFVAAKPECLKSEDDSGGNLLFSAAWSEGPAVRFLIDMGVPMRTEKEPWCAIAAPITEKLIDNFNAMVVHLDLDEPIEATTQIRMVHYAARCGNLYVIEYLDRHGATLDVVDGDGKTALIHAAECDQAEIFRYLMKRIDILKQDKWRHTAISAAAWRGAANVLSVFLDEEASRAKLNAALQHRNLTGDTPLMIAARYRQADALRVLLSAELLALGNPSADMHRSETGDALFHIVLRGFLNEEVSDTDKTRARAIVERLLQDRRLDPNLKNAKGETPLDIDTPFALARDLLREDDRVPRVYSRMDPAMRIADLSSRNSRVVMRLLKEAPEALTDLHKSRRPQDGVAIVGSNSKSSLEGNQYEGETGLDILVRLNNHAVLAKLAVLETHWPVLRMRFHDLLAVAAQRPAQHLREALSRRFETRDIGSDQAGDLLGACLDADDLQTARGLADHGAPAVLRRSDRGDTVLHRAAMGGEVEWFGAALAVGRLPLPRDDWGRRPSDLASETLAETFRIMEMQMDDADARIMAQATPASMARHAPLLALERDADARPADPHAMKALQKEWKTEWGDIEAMDVRIFDLPFQPGIPLIDVRRRTSSPRAGRLCFLLQDDSLYRLDGTSPPIHAINGKKTPIITDKTALEYLAFFCFFVRGGGGPFLVVDRPQGDFLPDLGKDKDVFEKAFRPPCVWRQDEKGDWLVSALLYYSDGLFFADFRIAPSGLVEMVSDTLLLANLPARIDAPLDLPPLS